jgi:HSP20 family protein
MGHLHNEMNRLFGRFSFNGVAGYPALNAWEDDASYFVEAELPGMELADLEIVVTGDQLTIKGERKAPAIEQGAWHRRERAFGAFARTLELPAAVDADRVEAKLSSGVLLVQLPKSEKARPRKIEVKAE